LSATQTTQFECSLPVDVASKLIYYFNFFLDNLVMYARREPYLLVSYTLDIVERRSGSYVVRWGYPSLLRRAHVNVTMPTRAELREGKILVTGQSDQFTFTYLFEVSPSDDKSLIKGTRTCTGNIVRCQEFLELITGVLRLYMKDPPRDVLDIVVHLPPPIPVAKPPVEVKPPTPPTPPPTRVERPPAKLAVTPEQALDPLNIARSLLKAPLVASIDLKPTWSVKDLLSFFKSSAGKLRDYTYALATMRSDGDLDVTILLDQGGDIVAWRGVIEKREHDISKPDELISKLQNYGGREVRVRIWGCKAS
jgi:hypothetical protein